MRRLLTKDVVDTAKPPQKNEYWIADTRIRGFGLRVWKSPSGKIKKSYALRIKGQNGKFKRETFLTTFAMVEKYNERQWESWWESNSPKITLNDITLGDVVEAARIWAQARRDTVFGRKFIGDDGTDFIRYISLAEEIKEQTEALQNRIKTYSFSKVKDIQLERLKFKGRSQDYLDRLDFLFEQHIAETLKSKNLFDIEFREVESAILNINEVSSIKKLRPFIGQLFELPREYGLVCQTSAYDIREIKTPDRKIECEFVLKQENISRLFRYLEKIEDKWQQALCLRLYFSMKVPMSTLMSARWDQLEQGNNETTIWRYGQKWKFDRIDNEFLYQLKDLHSHFPESLHWFPSPSIHHSDHIKSVAVVWSRCLNKFVLPEISPRRFREIYHEQGFYRLSLTESAVRLISDYKMDA